jgi:Rod binding domain-containing protein
MKAFSPMSSIRDQQVSPSRVEIAIDRSKVDPQLLEAAEGMEEMFLNYMMQVMRKTVQTSQHSMESSATKIYQNMLDSEYAKVGAKTGGVGLADLIIAYAQPDRYTVSTREFSNELPQKERSGERPEVVQEVLNEN